MSDAPSLVDPESQGGDYARQGFAHQDDVVMNLLPRLLADNAFASIVCEAMGDIEIKFFDSENDFVIDLIEAKNYQLSAKSFWKEVERFYTLHQTGQYRNFVIIAKLPQEFDQLIRMLRRIRNPGDFYGDNSPIVEATAVKINDVAVRLGGPAAVGEFLLTSIIIDTSVDTYSHSKLGTFIDTFTKCFPRYNVVPKGIFNDLYTNVRSVVLPTDPTNVTRSEIQVAINRTMPDEFHFPAMPISIHTRYDATPCEPGSICLDWTKFFGGSTRTYPPQEMWNEELVKQTKRLKAYLSRFHLNNSAIKLNGGWRLSTVIAFASIFSATSGYRIELERRDGTSWHTDNHARPDEESELQHVYSAGRGTDLVVSIGIPSDISSQVEKFLNQSDMVNLPRLNIVYSLPIVSDSQANSLVAQAKHAIRIALTTSDCSRILLFCAVPDFFALLLGHRLNATASIQCFEWVGATNYVPTCFLDV